MVDRAERIRGILESVASQMLVDFNASKHIEHRGSKGTVRETVLRTGFLDKYLPGGVAVVGSGEVIATDGQTSGQCDVMVVDPATPPWWEDEDFRIVPAECVDAVIEVKSNLTVAELRSAWQGIRRVKALPKTAFRPPGMISYSTNLYGRSWDHWPTLGFVFAYDGADIDTLARELAELARSEPDPAMRVDGVYVLNRGSVLWLRNDTGMYAPTGGPGDSLVGVKGSPAEVLAIMLGMFNVVFTQVNRRVFDALPYLTFGMGTASSRWPTL